MENSHLRTKRQYKKYVYVFIWCRYSVMVRGRVCLRARTLCTLWCVAMLFCGLLFGAHVDGILFVHFAHSSRMLTLSIWLLCNVYSANSTLQIFFYFIFCLLLFARTRRVVPHSMMNLSVTASIPDGMVCILLITHAYMAYHITDADIHSHLHTLIRSSNCDSILLFLRYTFNLNFTCGNDIRYAAWHFLFILFVNVHFAYHIIPYHTMPCLRAKILFCFLRLVLWCIHWSCGKWIVVCGIVLEMEWLFHRMYVPDIWNLLPVSVQLYTSCTSFLSRIRDTYTGTRRTIKVLKVTTINNT